MSVISGSGLFSSTFSTRSWMTINIKKGSACQVVGFVLKGFEFNIQLMLHFEWLYFLLYILNMNRQKRIRMTAGNAETHQNIIFHTHILINDTKTNIFMSI
eukprot:scaffold2998_cov158-Ochromonas_danica.AAC.5